VRPVPRISSVSPVKNPVGRQEAVRIVSMAGRIEDVEAHAFDLHPVAVGDPHRHRVDLALLAHHGDAKGTVAQRAEAGDVIGMQKGVDRLHQLEVELGDELQVALDLFNHRVDDHRLADSPTGQEIAIVPETASNSCRKIIAHYIPACEAKRRAISML